MLRFKDIGKKLFFDLANQKRHLIFKISRLVIELAAHLGH